MTAYSVACLAGDGIGPEVMAQASRGLRAAGRLHGFELDEQHVPFGADATMRVGHPFPLATRNTAGNYFTKPMSEGCSPIRTLFAFIRSASR